jgi:hypothetical protein
MGYMEGAIEREEEDRRKQDRFASTLVVAAAIIAAVRLAGEPEIKASPKVLSVVGESVTLARMTLHPIVH